MFPQYDLTHTEQGSYRFTTDNGLEYVAFFTTCPIEDDDGNMHKVYSFGFERSGKYASNKFVDKYDQKIKHTIVSIIKNFFKSTGDNAIIYLCFPEDKYARHRSITFSRWYSESLSDEIQHIKKNIIIRDDTYYAGILVRKENPLRELIVEAVNVYINQIIEQE